LLRQLKTQSSQYGAAIIVALFVTSIVAIAAVAMIERLRIDMRRMTLLQNNSMAYFYAQGSIAWGLEQLNANWKDQKPNTVVDHLPLSSPIDEIANVTIQSTLDSPEGKFNLNNLINSDYDDIFLRLLKLAYPKFNDETAKSLLIGVRDWISTSENRSQEEYYLKQNPPYRSPHRPMVSVSELRLVKGVTADIYQALLPYVTALPDATKINVNCAPDLVIQSLSPTLSKESAQKIVLLRKEHPFASNDAFLQLDIIKNNTVSDTKISTLSRYFLLKTDVTLSDQHTTLFTLIQRTIKNSKPEETIIWQSKGTL